MPKGNHFFEKGRKSQNLEFHKRLVFNRTSGQLPDNFGIENVALFLE